MWKVWEAEAYTHTSIYLLPPSPILLLILLLCIFSPSDSLRIHIHSSKHCLAVLSNKDSCLLLCYNWIEAIFVIFYSLSHTYLCFSFLFFSLQPMYECISSGKGFLQFLSEGSLRRMCVWKSNKEASEKKLRGWLCVFEE